MVVFSTIMLIDNAKVLLFLSLILMILRTQTSAERSLRTKRKIVFPQKSRFFNFHTKEYTFTDWFQVRLVLKEDIFKNNPVYVYVLGFKVLWDLPTSVHHLPIRRRSIYQDIEHIIDRNGLDGRECIFHYLCEASRAAFPNTSLFQKALQIIFTIPKGDEHSYHPYNVTDYCEATSSYCALSLAHLESSTDED